MKQLIKKILKEESLKHNLKQQIKDYGWEETAEMEFLMTLNKVGEAYKLKKI